MQLSIKDRESLVAVLCEHQPDLVTPTVRPMIPAYEPIIRALHNATDLSGGMADLQSFMTDLIKLSKVNGKAADSAPPNVLDFYHLIKKHAPSSHKFLHQTLKNSTDLYEMYYEYAQEAVKQYKQRTDDSTKDSAAGALTNQLQDAFSAFRPEDASLVKGELDQYGAHLSDSVAGQTKSFQNVVKGVETGVFERGMGPGIYLVKWQELIDDTIIAPSQPQGSPRLAGQDMPLKGSSTPIDESTASADKQLGDKGKSHSLPQYEVTLRLFCPVFISIIARS